MFTPIRTRSEARIFDPFRMFDGVAQSFPEFLRRRQMDRKHQPVRAGEGISLRLSWARVGTRRFAMGESFRRGRDQESQNRAYHRRIDLLALAGTRASHQCAQYAER